MPNTKLKIIMQITANTINAITLTFKSKEPTSNIKPTNLKPKISENGKAKNSAALRSQYNYN